jgi:hypothetical protein
MGHGMSGSGDEPVPDAFWVSVRQRYETGSETVAAIAAGANLSAQALTSRARAEGWRLRGKPAAKPAGTRETIARLKALLQQRLGDFESQIGALGEAATAATNERDIRSMNTLVRTLEKVLELERKDRAQRSKQRKAQRQFDDAEREALADKLEGLRQELANEAADEAAEQPAGETPQP